MKILIAGAGKVGYNIAKNLMVRHDVIVIDQNEQAIANIQEHLDVLALCGNIENPHILQTLPQEIDLFIAVTNTDEVNLLSSLIIDSVLDVKKKIIRLKNHFFNNDHIKDKLSIDNIIFPYVEAAKPFQYLIDFPHIRNIKVFKHTKALLVSIQLPETFEMTMIENLWRDMNEQMVVAGVERDGEFMTLQPADMLVPKDLVYLFAFPCTINTFCEQVFNQNGEHSTIRNCLIMGANSLGIEIARVLDKKGLNIQLLDQDLERCQQAKQILKNKVNVIKSNYESDLHLQENAENIDFFISAIGQDEFNITQCMMAKKHGIPKIVGINNNRGYSSLMRTLGMEVVRGTKIYAFHSILEIIHSSNIIVQKNFCGDEGVVLLRKIFHEPKVKEKKLKIPAKFEQKCIGFIVRNDHILPLCSIHELDKDDLVLLFTAAPYQEGLTQWLDQVL